MVVGIDKIVDFFKKANNFISSLTNNNQPSTGSSSTISQFFFWTVNLTFLALLSFVVKSFGIKEYEGWVLLLYVIVMAKWFGKYNDNDIVSNFVVIGMIDYILWNPLAEIATKLFSIEINANFVDLLVSTIVLIFSIGYLLSVITMGFGIYLVVSSIAGTISFARQLSSNPVSGQLKKIEKEIKKIERDIIDIENKLNDLRNKINAVKQNLNALLKVLLSLVPLQQPSQGGTTQQSQQGKNP